MSRENAIAKAAPIFSKDELLKVLHFTDDNQCFPMESRAIAHQLAIGGDAKNILTLKREDMPGAESAKELEEEKVDVLVDNKVDDIKDEETDEVKEEEKDDE